MHTMAAAFVLQRYKSQTLVFLVRNKSDTLEQNWPELKLRRAVGESSKALSLCRKMNYVGNVFHRRVAEHCHGNVKSSRKDF